MRVLLAAVTGAAVATVASAAGATATRGAYFADPAWSPDGGSVAFVDRASGRVHIVTENGKLKRILETRGRASSPTWSPDGQRLAFAYARGGIAVIGANGGGLRRLTSTGSAPDWSPSSALIAYSAATATGSSAIYVMRPDGTRRRLVATAPRRGQTLLTPSWAPGGDRLVFCICLAAGAGSPSIRGSLGLVGLRGRRVQRLAQRYQPIDPDWSPSGRRIVFSDGGIQIDVLDIRTGATRSLRAGQHPRWSPDGRRIIYGDSGVICIMNAKGSESHALVGSPPNTIIRACAL